MANTKESRVIRARNIESGVITFQDVKTKKAVVCEARDLFAGLNESWRVEGLKCLDELFDYDIAVEKDENWLKFWQGLPVIIRHLILHGINGKVVDTVASADKDGPKTMRASWAALKAETWSQGGGGSPLDTYTVVLREMISDALVSIGHKKADAQKTARDNHASAYRLFIESLTPAVKDEDAESRIARVTEGFNNVWPTIQATAKTEADRRDNAAPVVDVAALLAAATLPTKDAKKDAA